jgi:hypothetical protein
MGEFIRWYFQDRHPCCIAAPNEDKNIYKPINFPFLEKGVRGI